MCFIYLLSCGHDPIDRGLTTLPLQLRHPALDYEKCNLGVFAWPPRFAFLPLLHLAGPQSIWLCGIYPDVVSSIAFGQLSLICRGGVVVVWSIGKSRVNRAAHLSRPSLCSRPGDLWTIFELDCDAESSCPDVKVKVHDFCARRFEQ